MNSVVFTNQEGHLSIAQAVVHFLEEHHIETELAFKHEPGLQYYKLLYQHFPQLFAPIYQFSKTKLADFFLKTYSTAENVQFVSTFLDRVHPSLVFNTSLGFSTVLENAREKHDFTFINVMPNPRTFFKQDICKADVICVFDEQTQKDVLAINDQAQIEVTGWFVRPQFEQNYDKEGVKKELGLQQNLPTFLFVSGSEGMETIIDQVEQVRNTSHLQLVVACGNNQGLLEKINTLQEGASATILALPFTTEIYKYMQAADLVVGKAGPNMVFESVATHTPFFATTHVSGLEDGNLELIREYEIGFVEEDPVKAAEQLKKLAKQPDLLEKLLPQVKNLAKYNKTKKEVLGKYLK